MGRESFFIALTYKIVLRSTRRADGSATVQLRLIINRKKRDFNLNVSWPPDHFDTAAGKALPRHKKDTEHDTINTVISHALARAHYIRMGAFARGQSLTLDDFAREFEHYDSKDNVLWYWRQKMDRRKISGEISEGAYRHHQVTLVHVLHPYLKNGPLFFNELSPEFLHGFETHLRKTYMYNTATGHLKNLKTYLNLARKDGYVFTDPFAQYRSLSFRDGYREALTGAELDTLIAMLAKPMLPTLRAVLERFLFSCYTGIRISDASRVTAGMIHEGVLSLKMKKGERYGKVVHIPLPQVALDLIAGRTGKLFEPLADQTVNDTLKIIAGIAGITKRLTYHVSRDTFGTMFIEMGGDVATLKELMGHTNVATTMIYVKISQKHKELQMANFDKFFGAKPPHPDQ